MTATSRKHLADTINTVHLKDRLSDIKTGRHVSALYLPEYITSLSAEPPTAGIRLHPRSESRGISHPAWRSPYAPRRSNRCAEPSALHAATVHCPADRAC